MTLEIPELKSAFNNNNNKDLSVIDCSVKSIEETSSSEEESSYYQEENVLGFQLRRRVIGAEK